jgi:hypothetical protein
MPNHLGRLPEELLNVILYIFMTGTAPLRSVLDARRVTSSWNLIITANAEAINTLLRKRGRTLNTAADFTEADTMPRGWRFNATGKAAINASATHAGANRIRSLNISAEAEYSDGSQALCTFFVETIANRIPHLRGLFMPNGMSRNSIKKLARFSELTTLGFANSLEFDDVSELSALGRLRSLSMPKCRNLVKLNGIGCSVPNLVSLQLWGCDKLVDVTALRCLSHLAILTLDMCGKLKSLAGLGEVPNLLRLNANGCTSLTSLSDISAAPKLHTVCLKNNGNLPAVNPLARMPKLSQLDLRNCPNLTSVGVMSTSTTLETLLLHECRAIEDLKSLGEAPVLKQLAVSHASSETFVALGKSTELKSLSLATISGFKNLDSLQWCTSLTELRLWNCDDVTTFEGLELLPNLSLLSFKDCRKINTLEHLCAVKKLRKVAIAPRTQFSNTDLQRLRDFCALARETHGEVPK